MSGLRCGPVRERILDETVEGKSEYRIAEAERFPVQVVRAIVREELDTLRRFRARAFLEYGTPAKLMHELARREVVSEAETYIDGRALAQWLTSLTTRGAA